MTQASRSCWKCLKPGEFPWKTSIVDAIRSSPTYSTKSFNVFCFNVEENLLKQFQSVVDKSNHTVYSLSESDWTNNVWQHSTALLIVSECFCKEDHSDEIKKVNDFIVNSNGKVLLLLNTDCCQSPNEDGIYAILNSMESFVLRTAEWTWKKIDQNLCLMNSRDAPVLVIAKNPQNEMRPESMSSALNMLGISCVFESAQPDTIPASSDVLLSCGPTNSTEEFDSLTKLLTDEIKARIELVSPENIKEAFSFSDYLSARGDTSNLGRNIFWADVLTSSFTICQSILPKLPKQSGLVLVSAEQSAGIGRSNNRWISPRGMALFTLHFDLPLLENERSCEMTRVLTWTQHLSSIAVLLTLQELLDQYIERDKIGFELRVKWPNDVYAIDKTTNASTKLAGALATATVSNMTDARCLVGIGINVANSKPTRGFHDLIRMHCSDSNLALPSVATVIGRTISHLEKLIVRLERGDTKGIQDLYTSSWMHSGQKIKGLAAEKPVECTIVGVDEFGYLRAVEDEKGEEIILHPDGNSIDMTSGTIISRRK
ncbi:hypothetical protein Aperf_G00000050722 [Anoplocephala perfoliata]